MNPLKTLVILLLSASSLMAQRNFSGTVETDPEKERATFKMAPGFEANLFAAVIAACQGRGKPACEILEGHRSTTLAHLGNLACRLGRPLRYDGSTESVLGDPEANGLLGRKGRGSFVIPDKL
jgi:hypothetical protein